MRNYSVSVFLPVYNFPPARLEKNVHIIHDFLKKNYPAFEILIADDNSNSVTREGLRALGSKLSVTVLSYANGPSRRENLGVSFKKARYDILCFMDVDLATDLAGLPPLTDSIHQGHDIAIGSRYKGITAVRKAQRRIISVAYRTVLKILFQTRVQDHTCGFKAFRKSKVLPLIDAMGFDHSHRRGWFWDAELLIRAQDAGYSIDEIAVTWKADNESTFSVKREVLLIPVVAAFWFSRMRRVIFRKG